MQQAGGAMLMVFTSAYLPLTEIAPGATILLSDRPVLEGAAQCGDLVNRVLDIAIGNPAPQPPSRPLLDVVGSLPPGREINLRVVLYLDHLRADQTEAENSCIPGEPILCSSIAHADTFPLWLHMRRIATVRF